MGRGEKQPAKVDEEEEEGAQKEPNVVVDLTDDEEDLEANEDLSLKIVEKSVLKRRAKLESDVNGVVNLCDDTNSEDNDGTVTGGTNGGGVAKSSSSSSLETEVIVEGPDGVTKKKRKKRISRIEGGEQSVIIIEDEDQKIEPITEGHKADEKTEEAQDTELAESVDPNSVEISDNIVLKKLLRGPRYFDPPDNGWPSCFKCGEDGHMAVNCTSLRKKKPCFVCGSLDHGPKQCGKGRDCYICRTAGHRAKDCPERLKGIAQTSKICVKCGGSGHEMYTCRNSYSEDDLKEIKCYICKRFGHLCCVNDVDDGGFMLSCYRCGAVGHTGMACSRISNHATISTADTTASPSSCYRCGIGGHFARDCTTPSMAGKRNRELSAPTFKPQKQIITGQNSAPPDVSKASKKRKIKKSKQEAGSVTDEKPETKPKQRGGWLTEYVEDYDSNLKPSPKKKSKKGSGSVAESQPSQKKSKKKKKAAIEDHQNPLPRTPPSKKKSKRKGGNQLPPTPSSKTPKQRGGWYIRNADNQPQPPLTPPPYRNNNMHTPSSSSHYHSPAPRYQRFPDHPPPYQSHYSSHHHPTAYHHHQQQQRFYDPAPPFHGGGQGMPPYHHERFSGPPQPFRGVQQPTAYNPDKHPARRFGNGGSEYGEYSRSYDDHTRYHRNYDWR